MTTNFGFATDTRLRAAQYLSPGYCAHPREGGLWLLTSALLVSCCCPCLVKLSVAPPRKIVRQGAMNPSGVNPSLYRDYVSLSTSTGLRATSNT